MEELFLMLIIKFPLLGKQASFRIPPDAGSLKLPAVSVNSPIQV